MRTCGPEDAPQEASLWERYRLGEAGAIEGLILHYAPLVKFVVGRVAAGISKFVDREELVHYGVLGLYDAIRRYDPERGVRFERYAAIRIRGAVLDELRSLDWVPRSVRSRARELQRGVAELEQELQRSPTDDELAAYLDTPTEDLRRELQQIDSVGVLALDKPVQPGDRGSVAIGDLIADPDALDPCGPVEQAETKRIVAQAISKLPDRERQVVVLYHFEGLTLADIGRVFGVTESRICQIHARALVSLRNQLARPDLGLSGAEIVAGGHRPRHGAPAAPVAPLAEALSGT